MEVYIGNTKKKNSREKGLNSPERSEYIFMDLNAGNMKKIKRLILFTAVVCLIVIKIEVVLKSGTFLLEMTKPFLIGAAIAFVLNIPMSAIEKRLFARRQNFRYEGMKRPVSILLALIAIVLVFVLGV